MLNPYIQIKPDTKENKLTLSGMLLLSRFMKVNHAIVIAVPENETELQEGDEIFYAPENENEIEIGGETVCLITKGAIYCKVKGEELIPLHNTVLLSIDTSQKKDFQQVSSFLTDAKGYKIRVERHEEEFDTAPKQGTVAFIGKITNFRNDHKIRKGDKVYHHHLASSEDFKITFNSKIYYRQNFNELFAVEREGKILPLERYVFIKPLDDNITSSGIITTANPKHTKGIIKYSSVPATEKGFLEGSEVSYTKAARYEIFINGELLYKTRVDNIYMCSTKAVEAITI